MSLPSIFNDVLGPVMRGPSSSHSAAALRIGRLIRQLMNNNIKKLLVEYDPNGSLVTTHKSQGTDMGLAGGLLGWDPTDERLIDYEKHIEAAGIDIVVRYVSYGANHPNTYKLTMSNDHEEHRVTALSTGGGMIEVIEIDGAIVSMAGDYYELIVYVESQAVAEASNILRDVEFFGGDKPFFKLKSTEKFNQETIEELKITAGVISVKTLDPVLPVLGVDGKMPFTNCEEMVEYNTAHNFALWELAMKYEAARSSFTEGHLYQMMLNLVGIFKHAVESGIQGTEYEDRILPSQAPGFQKKKKSGSLLDNPLSNEIILATTAMMEVKSSMGIIVAAPTAGSCGALPGAVIGAARVMNYNDDQIAKALFAAGIIGVFIAKGSTFAAEEAGCMAETGSGGSMGAAALVTFAEGSLEQTLSAASIALQNSLGIICDPIGNRVEAPCLGKNVMAAGNALSCANMALADYKHLIPFDEVVEAMNKVGKAMPHEHCCTGLGGLAMTPTAKKIEAGLENGKVKITC
jgi:L-serine dehydratase